jgi:hypothetical protein
MGNAKEKDVQGWSKIIVLDIVIVKSRQVDKLYTNECHNAKSLACYTCTGLGEYWPKN